MSAVTGWRAVPPPDPFDEPEPDDAPSVDDSAAFMAVAGDAGVDAPLVARWIADAHSGNEPFPRGMPERARWLVTDDDRAEWALRKLAEAKEDLEDIGRRWEAYTAKLRAHLAKYDEWRKLAEQAPLTRVAHMTALLERYALERREATGQASVRLPHGKLTTSAGRRRLVVLDAGHAVEHLAEVAPHALRTHEPEVMVSRFNGEPGYRWDATLEDSTEASGLCADVDSCPVPGDPLAGEHGPSRAVVVTVTEVPCVRTMDGELVQVRGLGFIKGETTVSVELL